MTTTNDVSPAQTVGFHVAALMRGDALPPPTSRDAEVLLQAMRVLLASQVYPRATAAGRNELALLVLGALNSRMRAAVEAVRRPGQGGAQ